MSRSIKAEVGFKVERAPVSDINKTRRRANVLRKRSKRISLNSLLKEAGNNTILKRRKQKRSLVLSLKT